MSRYFNEEGEPLMTAAEIRLEDELDELARFEPRDPDDEYDAWRERGL